MENERRRNVASCDPQLVAELRAQLKEAQDTLDAIRNGEVDAVVVGRAGSGQIFTLQNADRPYRFLIEQMKEGAVTLSEEGVILYGNPRLAEILGAPLEKIVGTNLKNFISPGDSASLDELMSGSSARVSRGEFLILQASGCKVPVYLSINEIVSDASDVRLLGAILTDLSEQRQMEERLRQAQKMEAVGQLTGGLAHDFNNLLQAICGNLNLIKLRPDDGARAQKWAEKGLQAAQRGAKLTSQLLAFSRLQQVDLKPLNASALVSGMLDLLRHTLGPGIEIVYALDDSDAAVLADQTQLELAVLNLAINARDAMPNGGVLKIATALRTVRNDAELVSDEYLELSVSDSGAGMPESVRSRAFDPFFTTKGVGQGTGLGLAQVYGIAHQAGGTARIESEAGKGTTVTLLLRRSRESACDCLNAEDNEGAAEIKKTAKVLVIDDDDDVLGFLVESLQLLGYTVSSASDGMAGLAMMAADPPDILLIDYAMPKLNGAEVVKLAREKGLMMPVIFASGYSDMSALDEAVGLKANLILKPFTIANLSAELQKVLLSEHAPAM